MTEFDQLDDGDDGTVFRDVIMLALLGFVTVVVLLLPHLNPPVKASQDVNAPGNVVVEVRWPDGLDADVDLWVEAPGDVPVGYSNKGGRVFNLLRDDLGMINDPSTLNYEVAFSRGRPAGEYIVNLHLYTNNSHQYPVNAEVSVGIKKRSAAGLKNIAFRKVSLVEAGQELTVIRFRLDDHGDLVPSSINDLPHPLRTAQKS